MMSQEVVDKAWSAWPWRSIIGIGNDENEMMQRVGAIIAVRDCEPLSTPMLADAIATIARGKTVFVIAARRTDRDYARQQILAMAGGGSRA